MKKIPYLRLWAKIFDFKSKDSLKTGLVDTALMILVHFVLTFVCLANENTVGGLAFAFMFLQIFLLLPSLTVRRLRGAGFSPYWALFLLLPVVGIFVLIPPCTFSNTEGDDEIAAAKKRKRHLRQTFIFMISFLLLMFFLATSWVWLTLLEMLYTSLFG